MSNPTHVSTSRVIVASALDVWLSGGASIVVLALLGFGALLISPDFLLEKFLVLTVALNGTHFLASYRLLYSSRTFALSYPWASVYVPLFLVVYALGALCLVAANPEFALPVKILIGTASIYLALHYTGQAWGMMASYAYLDGVKFSGREKSILRATLKVMAAWHALWALRLLWTPEGAALEYLAHASEIMNSAGGLSLVAGLVTLWQVGKSGGRRVTARVVVPYVALYTWYTFLFFHPSALFWVQLFHAIQYLPFPMRVELNRVSQVSSSKSRGTGAALLPYCLVLLAGSAFIFAGLPWLAGQMGPGANSVWVVIASVINIHHYFIDGCIWRISNPVVSKELFAHTHAPAQTS